ncbi:respiratory chain protein (soxI homolog) [Pyrobaculum aerophilum str. IM2]|uniref:Respiratory chain protein (SoxI homolog) n=1 Tax=Pyrobaculum aerophilum (strain ATCC 51768 / DSM 7523 / JCM 9630 / CIP 104966 / NBRC 100827 / IM2) TaxID=178306 RepID=Q8ZXC9_PYRAE|nr:MULTISPECIES: hypothetical protein [Pyrobaculum]AAL63419.1 respiratory chain protein (soxI homolog) [Pyrobaculum aerophilum str. IM2]
MWSLKDTLATAGIVLGILITWLFLTNFGKPPFEPASYISQIIFSAYSLVIISAGVVASIFIGAMIYFTYKFRDRGHGEG